MLFDPDTGETRAMRTKEDAADYRYFPDPDLPPLVIAPEWVAVAREWTELPRHGWRASSPTTALPEYDATTLTQSKAMAAILLAAAVARPAQAGQQLDHGEVSRRLNAGGWECAVARKRVGQLAALIGTHRRRNRVQQRGPPGVRSVGPARVSDVDAVIEAMGLKQMNDSGALENCRRRDRSQPGQRGAVQGRQGQGIQRLVGQVMKASKGKANPATGQRPAAQTEDCVEVAPGRRYTFIAPCAVPA